MSVRERVKRLDMLFGGHAVQLRRRWQRAELMKDFPVPPHVHDEICHIQQRIPVHWCHWAKTQVLAHLILQNNLKRTLEIGVFTGYSFIPQVVGVKETGGIAIGIDPYLAEEAQQFENIEIRGNNSKVRSDQEWNEMYMNLLALLDRNNLNPWYRLLRKTSEEAAASIEPGLDLVHIDGNHDWKKVQSDLKNYVPKLKSGGFLVMDDIGWPSISDQYNELKRTMKMRYEVPNVWGCLIRQ